MEPLSTVSTVVNTRESPDSLQRSNFRSAATQGQGTVSAHVVEGIVADINLVLWTVDVASKFDQKFYANVQISSPYMHHNTGEGIYAMPDIGAKCHICIASDGVPYVLDFIMPVETLDQAPVDMPLQVPAPPTETSGTATAASFAGGRVRAKPGDIMIRGRNGNFVVLHRGGVLQIGASELAQRIYIPLQNLISDISQTYRHYNTGGAINWYLAPGESETNPSTIYRETYRLLAGDKKASIRITIGHAKDIIAETTNSFDALIAGIGTPVKDNPIVCEVALAPDAIEANSGAIDKKTPKETKLRYVFDKKGNVFLRSEGNILVIARKTLRLISDEDVKIDVKERFIVTADSARIDGGKLLELKGELMILNGGTAGVARIGDSVQISIVQPLISFAPAAPGAPVVIGPTGGPTAGGSKQPFLTGIITSGNKTVVA